LLGPDGLPLSRPAPKHGPVALRSNADPVTERVEDFNGGFRIHTEQLCDDTLQAVHDAGDLIPKKTAADGARYMGSVPVVQALIWSKECGAAVGTREWAEYARKKMETGGFSKLKAALK
jgi:hypothetical protein